MSSRLDQINWHSTYTQLNNDILNCPEQAQRDLKKLWSNLHSIAMEVSRLEVTERRTMGSSGRRADEKLAELERQVKYIQKMITIAQLSF